MKNILTRLWRDELNVAQEATDTQQRKRVVPLLKRTSTLILGTMIFALGLGGAGVWANQSGWLGASATAIKWSAIKHSAGLGFTVEDVLVTGRHETQKDVLLSAIGVARGTPILAYDFEQAKLRVEALPWVHHAQIERMLPDTLVVRLVERRPIALWQEGGEFSLIDEDGKVITREGLERFSGLIQLIGNDAPNRIGGLLEVLETQPLIKSQTRAATWVGGRRWDLQLASGVQIRLPETHAPAALRRLVTFEQESGILGRQVKVLDLRIPDRVIVRRVPGSVRKPSPETLSKPKIQRKGQET